MARHQIMIIEDEPDIRETVKEMLELSGFEVFAAENGKEGLRMLESIEKPCLILLDLMMPVMNGWEFLATLKSQYQHILASTPVTVVSAVADSTDVQQQYGCDILKKPVSMDRLVALAQQHCEAC